MTHQAPFISRFGLLLELVTLSDRLEMTGPFRCRDMLLRSATSKQIDQRLAHTRDDTRRDISPRPPSVSNSP